MPVQSDVIKARIKAKYPTLNLSKERLDAIAAKLAQKPADDANEQAIDTVIDNFNDVLSLADIAKEDDRLRNAENLVKAIKTPEQIATEKAATEAAEKAAKEKEEAEKGMPDWAKTFIGGIDKKFEALSGKLSEFETKAQTQTKLQKATELFNASEVLKNLPDAVKASWLQSRLNPDSDASEQITALETEAALLVGGDNTPPTIISGAPPASKKLTAPSDAELSSVIDSM